MSKRRMLHAKISDSMQVNRLLVPARLLFTWMIAHADDEGRLQGDIDYIRGLVVPQAHWSVKKVQNYIEAMKKEGLIYRWQENNEWFIEFVKWTDHQYIQKDRFKASPLPKYNKESINTLDTDRIQDGNNSSPQAKGNEVKEIEVKKSETNTPEEPNKEDKWTNPRTFEAKNEGEVAALHAWDQLEHGNPMKFYPTYLCALRKGLPADKFYQFVSEIKQDSTIEKPGAVFNKKVEEYLKKRLLDRMVQNP